MVTTFTSSILLYKSELIILNLIRDVINGSSGKKIDYQQRSNYEQYPLGRIRLGRNPLVRLHLGRKPLGRIALG